MSKLKLEIDLSYLTRPKDQDWRPLARIISEYAMEIVARNAVPNYYDISAPGVRGKIGKAVVTDDKPALPCAAPLGEGFYWGRWTNDDDDEGTPDGAWEVFQVVYNSIEDDDLAAYVSGRDAMVPWNLITWGPRVDQFTGRV